jgi:arsenical pump membrane protein
LPGPPSGKIAAVGIVATAVVLLTSSALGIQLGLPTAVAGVITAIIVVIGERKWPWNIVKDVS